MIDLNDYFYFAHVVEQGGFAAAARKLNMPKSRLSRHVSALEDRLGVRLLQRSSRRIQVTEVGGDFYRHARVVLDEVAMAETEIDQRKSELAGTVRFSCSLGLAQVVLPGIIARFLDENPRVDILQQVSNEPVDLIADGIDIALRGHVAALPDSSMMHRRIARAPWHLFAAPRYLEKHGVPACPGELRHHSGLAHGWKSRQHQWLLKKADEQAETIAFNARMGSDDMLTIKHAAIEGHGIAALPAYVCNREIAAGTLVRLLPDWTAGEAEIALLMPSKRGIAPAVKALYDHLAAEIPKEMVVSHPNL